MKYHYEPPDIVVSVYGKVVRLDWHPIYKYGTLYLQDGKGLVVTQQNFMSASPNDKFCYWASVDPALANDIYLNPRFPAFFREHATEGPEYPIFQVRKIMWALRMKPLKKEEWEEYF